MKIDHMHSRSSGLSSEAGSAMVYIFIGVALFGALMFMYARSGSQNTSNMSQQQNSISASGLIDQGRALEGAVQKLLSAGCSESELSFDIPPYTANPNPSAPVDMHCHVFHPSGGKLNASAFPDWVYSSASEFPSIGGAEAELAAYHQGIDDTTCQKINEMLNNGLSSIPAFGAGIFTATFDGTFPASPNSLTPATGITAGCTGSTSHTPNVVFKALIVR